MVGQKAEPEGSQGSFSKRHLIDLSKDPSQPPASKVNRTKEITVL